MVVRRDNPLRLQTASAVACILTFRSGKFLIKKVLHYGKQSGNGQLQMMGY
jgi:hypothetical protein